MEIIWPINVIGLKHFFLICSDKKSTYAYSCEHLDFWSDSKQKVVRREGLTKEDLELYPIVSRVGQDRQDVRRCMEG